MMCLGFCNQSAMMEINIKYKIERMMLVIMLNTKALLAQVRAAEKLPILAYLLTFLELERAKIARKREIPYIQQHGTAKIVLITLQAIKLPGRAPLLTAGATGT